MSDVIIKVENIGKQYRLGEVGTGAIKDDIKRWRYKMMGKEDPFMKVGSENDRSKKADGDYVWAIKDINFEVKKGEVLGVIGRNGAGKSTLLKILSRTTSPTVGQIKIKGRIASLLEVGTGFHPELSGRENIFLNGAILGMTKQEIKSKFDEIVDFAGVEKYIDTPVKRYSSGMYVRLAFGVAAHLEPEILIVDEVLAVGDAEFQKKALGKMKDVSTNDGRTVLFVSHNLAAVKVLCDKAIILQNGLLQFQGTSEEGVSKYLEKDREHEFNLAERTDRTGNQSIHFTGISILNQQGKSVSEIYAGEKIKIQLNYDINAFPISSKLIVSLVFYDFNENMVASFPSDEMGHTFDINGQSGQIVLEIDEFLLRPSRYYLSIYSFADSTSVHNAVDIIQNIFILTVLNNDFFKKGILIREGNYALLKGGYQ